MKAFWILLSTIAISFSFTGCETTPGTEEGMSFEEPNTFRQSTRVQETHNAVLRQNL
ncbi:MAG: hypothetical protein HKN23_06400 [Verrucomicrobiales bacterium]|nr:hypothetical protein [Verrucomicrobiales bacterium]